MPTTEIRTIKNIKTLRIEFSSFGAIYGETKIFGRVERYNSIRMTRPKEH